MVGVFKSLVVLSYCCCLLPPLPPLLPFPLPLLSASSPPHQIIVFSSSNTGNSPLPLEGKQHNIHLSTTYRVFRCSFVIIPYSLALCLQDLFCFHHIKHMCSVDCSWQAISWRHMDGDRYICICTYRVFRKTVFFPHNVDIFLNSASSVAIDLPSSGQARSWMYTRWQQG